MSGSLIKISSKLSKKKKKDLKQKYKQRKKKKAANELYVSFTNYVKLVYYQSTISLICL